ncbi:citrate lyase ACP [Thermovirga lienii]|jgi:citrate lyase subunit gamma (acyl carrier protein)|uniref:citrate lyase ACP n=1 Tax=Thermovirga lienii TaxID=336261 RepID=UPI00074AEB88|nr:MAG: Citrate lyase subunit gamma [Thermovirga lienii]MDN5319450.1 hypothetical protein [Thermovirga sp.]MDN5368057.1 hypothetical protein [Thermovirga sp.]HCD71647.1 citrate lyase ACP [Thermovirga lienii]
MERKDTPNSVTAQSGTLESSDCLVTCSLQDHLEIEYKGPDKADLLRERAEQIVRETVLKYKLKGAYVTIQDNGALAITMRARIETAIERCLGENDHEGR